MKHGCRSCGCDLLRLERRAGLCVGCAPTGMRFTLPRSGRRGTGYPARGFHNWPVAIRRAVAGQGGKRAHVLKRAHEFTHAEAVAAGQRSWVLRRQRQAA